MLEYVVKVTCKVLVFVAGGYGLGELLAGTRSQYALRWNKDVGSGAGGSTALAGLLHGTKDNLHQDLVWWRYSIGVTIALKDTQIQRHCA